MSIILRDYQEAIIAAAREQMKRHKRVLIQAPTGAGKTVLASFMLDSASRKGKRCWFIVHRQELVEQTAATFEKCGIRYGIVAAGYPCNPFSPIQICSIQTLSNRLSRLANPDLILFDECHHLGAATWDKVFHGHPGAWHIGVTATPVRLDGKGLGRWFDAMVEGPTVRWLIDNGHLSDYRLFELARPDLSGVHKRGGDYVTSELEEIMRGKAIVGGIVRHWMTYARGKRTILFAPSVKSSLEYVAAFQQAGVKAVHLDGKMGKYERRQAGQAFARGDVSILSNVDLFGEGFDLAALSGMDVTVEAGILARPTQSLGLYLQQVGRVLRKKDEPAIILDHCGHRHRHGLPCDERTWSLADKPGNGKAGEQEGVAPTRQCPKCYRVHRPAPTCPECGHVYEVKSRTLVEVEAELSEVDVAQLRSQRLAEQGQARTIDELVELGRKRGYKKPEAWAAHVFTARMAGRGK